VADIPGNPVEGIRPVAPRPSLITSCRKLSDAGIDYKPTLDEYGIPSSPGWQQGITFRDTSLMASGIWPYSPGNAHADKVAAVQATVAVFMPFQIYLPVACDDLTFARDAALVAEAESNAEAGTAWNLARELWTGATVNSVVVNNPSLQNPFPGPVGGPVGAFPAANVIAGPIDPVVAMGNLLQAYEDATQQGGAMFHVPAIAIPYLMAEKVVGQEGDLYRGPGGSIVVPGPGYPTTGPTGPKTAATPTGVVAGANQAWMYVTGPVEYDLTPIVIRPEAQEMRFFDPRTNLWRVWAERQAIYRFDPTSVFAELITVPQTGI